MKTTKRIFAVLVATLTLALFLGLSGCRFDGHDDGGGHHDDHHDFGHHEEGR